MAKSIFRLIALVSGFSGLGYQVLWSDQLGVLLGSTQWAITLVLAVFMSGLTLGSVSAAARCERIKSPLIMYAWVEIAIAIMAWCLPAVWGWMDLALVVSTGGALRAVAMAALVLLPTFLMGLTLPILVEAGIRLKPVGDQSTAVYGINTLGAALGAAISGFLILPQLGLQTANYILIAGNMVAAVMALTFVIAKSSSSINRGVIHSALPHVGGNTAILPLVIAFLCGASTFGYEVIWARMLVQVHGSDVYGFASMLTVLLIGIGAGALMTQLFKRTDAMRLLLFSQLLLLISIGASFIGILHTDSSGLTQFSWDQIIWQRFIATTLVLLPASVCLGMGVPLLVRWYRADRRRSGRFLGWIYAVNTLGAIVGAIGVGYWLIAVVNVADALVTVMLLNACVVILLVIRLKTPMRWVIPALAIIVSMPMWMHQTSTEALFRKFPLSKQAIRGQLAMAEMGTSSSVTLVENRKGWRLITNGLPESLVPLPGAGDATVSAATWLSLLPISLHDDPQRVFVAGFGGGLTVDSIPAHVSEILVAEIESKVVKANALIGDKRAVNPLSDARIRIEIEDARVLMKQSAQSFDVIVSQPSHPWTAGASHLYSQEYFETVAQSLSSDGIFSMWMGLQFVDQMLLEDLLYTLNVVFDEVQVFAPATQNSWIFLAANSNLPTINLDKYGRNAQYWQRVGVYSATEVQVGMVLNALGSKGLSAEGSVISVRHNQMKYRAPKILANPIGKAGAFAWITDWDALSQPWEAPVFDHNILFYAMRSQPAQRMHAISGWSPHHHTVASALNQDISGGEAVNMQYALESPQTADIVRLLYLETHLERLLSNDSGSEFEQAWIREDREGVLIRVEQALRNGDKEQLSIALPQLLLLVQSPSVLQKKAANLAGRAAVILGERVLAQTLLDRYLGLLSDYSQVVFRLAILAKQPSHALEALVSVWEKNRGNPQAARFVSSGVKLLRPFHWQLQSDIRYQNLNRRILSDTGI